MGRLYIGGVNLHLPWWGIIPTIIPPSAPSPNQITRMTVIPTNTSKTIVGETRNSQTDSDSPGAFSHVEPALGVLGLIIGIGLKLYPPTKVAGFLIAAGLAVINWGSTPAGGSQVESSGGGGGF